MGYINLIAYVQQEIDNILHEVWAWAQAYINNIVCNTRSLFDFLNKLQVLFEFFYTTTFLLNQQSGFLNI